MNGQLKDTLAELLDRKIIYLFGAVTIMVLLLTWAVGSLRIAEQRMLMGDVDLRTLDNALENPIASSLYFYLQILVFLSALATAGLIPAMLRRGRAEFFLSKPISRSSLIFSRFMSLLIVYGGMIMICGLAELLLVLIRHGIYGYSLLWILAGNFLSWFIWLSICTLAGILTRSGSMAMMSMFLIWMGQTLLWFYQSGKVLLEDSRIGKILDAFYYILPKMASLGDLTVALAAGRAVESWLPVWSSALFAVVCLWLAIKVVNLKDY